MNKPPQYHRLTGDQVQKIADALPKIIDERRKYPGSYPGVFTKGPTRWQVSYYSRDKPPKEIAQVIVDDPTGAVARAVDGLQGRVDDGARLSRRVRAQGQLAVGLGARCACCSSCRSSNWRRPFSVLQPRPARAARRSRVSLAFFNDAQIGVSVPLVYPLLLYLLLRMLWAGHPRRRGGSLGLHLNVPVALAGRRRDLPDGLSHRPERDRRQRDRRRLRGRDRRRQARSRATASTASSPRTTSTATPTGRSTTWPTSRSSRRCPGTGRGTTCPPRTRASIAFDVLCCLLLFLLGRQVRGPDLGVALAYAWAAYPFTLYVLEHELQRRARAACSSSPRCSSRRTSRRAACSPRSPG